MPAHAAKQGEYILNFLNCPSSNGFSEDMNNADHEKSDPARRKSFQISSHEFLFAGIFVIAIYFLPQASHGMVFTHKSTGARGSFR